MKIEIYSLPAWERKTKPNPSNLGFGQHFTDHMFMMDYRQGEGWYNPRIVPYQTIQLDPAALILHYAQAIFEGLKAYHGVDGKIRLFRPDMNAQRLNASAERLCMPTIDPSFFIEAVKTLVKLEKDWVPQAEGASLYIRPTMIATEPALGVRPALEYLFFIITSPVGAYYKEGFNPVKIMVTDKYVRAVPGGVGHTKAAANYAASLKAAQEAQAQGYSQVLWLDAKERRFVEEVGTMNIFFHFKEALVTPPLSGSILPGVTRNSVIHLAREWGIETQERPITIDEVLEGLEKGELLEIFGTGTAAVISPVGLLHYKGKDYTINRGKTGPLGKRFFQEITGIQYGTRPDPWSWTVVVD